MTSLSPRQLQRRVDLGAGLTAGFSIAAFTLFVFAFVVMAEHGVWWGLLAILGSLVLAVGALFAFSVGQVASAAAKEQGVPLVHLSTPS